MSIYEPELPKCNFNYNGHIRKLPDYRSLYDTYGPDTLIKCANTLGGFTFPLGSDLHETWVNRKKAQAVYAQRKAQAQIDIEILDDFGTRAIRLLHAVAPMKRHRPEVTTISESEEESEEEDSDEEDHTEKIKRIEALEEALRQLCTKYQEDPMAWGVL
jgi:hydroxymethylpyrimidine pyrophosphatase-like HAD family hydrolase